MVPRHTRGERDESTQREENVAFSLVVCPAEMRVQWKVPRNPTSANAKREYGTIKPLRGKSVKECRAITMDGSSGRKGKRVGEKGYENQPPYLRRYVKMSTPDSLSTTSRMMSTKWTTEMAKTNKQPSQNSKW